MSGITREPTDRVYKRGSMVYLFVFILFLVPSPITKEFILPAYSATQRAEDDPASGVIVHATEVDGILEEEGNIAAANIGLDRYRAFHDCMKGPKIKTYLQRELCWPEYADGLVYEICPTLPEHCARGFDDDCDGDVDLRDFAEFQWK